MLKYYNYDIVFQEYPDEVTLAINLTNVACGASALFRKVLLPESLRDTEPPNILSKSLVVHCTYLLKHILVDSAAKVKSA